MSGRFASAWTGALARGCDLAAGLRFGHPDILVSASVVEEPALVRLHQSFHEHDVGHLADLLPLFLGFKDWRIGAGQHFARIVLVEKHPPGAINKMVVGPV